MPFLVLNCNTVIIYITIDYIVSIMLLVNCQTVYTCMPIYDTDTNVVMTVILLNILNKTYFAVKCNVAAD